MQTLMQAFPIVDVSPSLAQAHVVWLISLLCDGWCCPLPRCYFDLDTRCLSSRQSTYLDAFVVPDVWVLSNGLRTAEVETYT